jgi:hypothetical protein
MNRDQTCWNYVVLTMWWFNSVWVHWPVCIWYSDISARIWTRYGLLCIVSFGWSAGVWILCAVVSVQTDWSRFIGGVSRTCLHHLWRWNRQCVPKRRHIQFIRRGISQMKEYNIHAWRSVAIKNKTKFTHRYSKKMIPHKGQTRPPLVPTKAVTAKVAPN